MKKLINKNTLFGFIIGGIIFGSIGVGAATYLYSSNQISYSNSNSSATDVKGALDDLYNLTNIGNATSADIYAGKTALVQGKLVTGTSVEKKEYQRVKTINVRLSSSWGGGSSGTNLAINVGYDANGNISSVSGSASWNSDGPNSASVTGYSIY